MATTLGNQLYALTLTIASNRTTSLNAFKTMIPYQVAASADSASTAALSAYSTKKSVLSTQLRQLAVLQKQERNLRQQLSDYYQNN